MRTATDHAWACMRTLVHLGTGGRCRGRRSSSGGRGGCGHGCQCTRAICNRMSSRRNTLKGALSCMTDVLHKQCQANTAKQTEADCTTHPAASSQIVRGSNFDGMLAACWHFVDQMGLQILPAVDPRVVTVFFHDDDEAAVHTQLAESHHSRPLLRMCLLIPAHRVVCLQCNLPTADTRLRMFRGIELLTLGRAVCHGAAA